MRKFQMLFVSLVFLSIGACDDYSLEDYGACATCPPIEVSRFEVCNDLIDNDKDRKSTRLNSSHTIQSRMPSSA